MQTFFEANQAWILPIIGALLANIITPLVRKLPANGWIMQLIRAVLSGVPKEPPQLGADLTQHIKDTKIAVAEANKETQKL